MPSQDVVDFKYLSDLVNQLKLTEDFSDVWQEAFPGEPLPADFHW